MRCAGTPACTARVSSVARPLPASSTPSIGATRSSGSGARVPRRCWYPLLESSASTSDNGDDDNGDEGCGGDGDGDGGGGVDGGGGAGCGGVGSGSGSTSNSAPSNTGSGLAARREPLRRDGVPAGAGDDGAG